MGNMPTIENMDGQFTACCMSGNYSEIAQRQGFRETSDSMGVIREAHETKPAGWMASGDGLELLRRASMYILEDKGIDDVRFLVEQVRALDYLDPNEEYPVLGLLNSDHEVALYLSKYVLLDKIESRLTEGRTPLENAVINGHLEAAQYLVQHKGAKVTVVTTYFAEDAPMREFLAQHLDAQDPVE